MNRDLFFNANASVFVFENSKWKSIAINVDVTLRIINKNEKRISYKLNDESINWMIKKNEIEFKNENECIIKYVFNQNDKDNVKMISLQFDNIKTCYQFVKAFKRIFMNNAHLSKHANGKWICNFCGNCNINTNSICLTCGSHVYNFFINEYNGQYMRSEFREILGSDIKIEYDIGSTITFGGIFDEYCFDLSLNSVGNNDGNGLFYPVYCVAKTLVPNSLRYIYNIDTYCKKCKGPVGFNQRYRWHCNICETENNRTFHACSSCGSPKLEKWICEQCHMQNIIGTNYSCQGCGNKRTLYCMSCGIIVTEEAFNDYYMDNEYEYYICVGIKDNIKQKNFNCNLNIQILAHLDGITIEAYGTDGVQDFNQGITRLLMNVEYSKLRKNGSIVLIKLKGNVENPIIMNASYFDIYGTKHESKTVINIDKKIRDSQDSYYGNNDIRKAILLSNYIKIIKSYLKNDYYGSLFRRLLGSFTKYFDNECKLINDDKLYQELKVLNYITNINTGKWCCNICNKYNNADECNCNICLTGYDKYYIKYDPNINITQYNIATKITDAQTRMLQYQSPKNHIYNCMETILWNILTSNHKSGLQLINKIKKNNTVINDEYHPLW